MSWDLYCEHYYGLFPTSYQLYLWTKPIFLAMPQEWESIDNISDISRVLPIENIYHNQYNKWH